ncbi:respiratory nitrite reductase-specific cytochrome c biogenesis protein NrfF [Mesocricetibacter intestinalis]|uniref:Formate-dependent nitrite reductase complex subunit n=1 Tax=Mesocricetibacter intestinalis TaxID=1521930 RepID=A0A4R6V8B9_9PAST|nr:heme lyase NrfEFG subunit NrfF [Mesocricetibacter intestinalis]TDQ57861.1 respiratory nitrite reductase-specific cytochrome c biogenesis protein NrfF [Mesocricetibacter intestinalis]
MKVIISVFLLLCSFCLQAEIVDTYPFRQTEDRIRATALAKSLRCPQCQNQNLVESNSPVAYELRLEVYRMVDEGKTDEQIVQAMVARFGDFVSYRPPFRLTTAILWAGPLLLFGIALLLMLRHIKQRAKSPSAGRLDDEQQKALQALLKKREEE